MLLVEGVEREPKLEGRLRNESVDDAEVVTQVELREGSKGGVAESCCRPDDAAAAKRALDLLLLGPVATALHQLHGDKARNNDGFSAD